IQAIYPDGRVRQRWRWDWQAGNRDSSRLTLEQAGEEFNRLFREGIRQRMRNGAIAAHLSGGMDSSAVVCAARDLVDAGTVPGTVRTLSLAYQTPSLAGETDYINMVVDQKG